MFFFFFVVKVIRIYTVPSLYSFFLVLPQVSVSYTSLSRIIFADSKKKKSVTCHSLLRKPLLILCIIDPYEVHLSYL